MSGLRSVLRLVDDLLDPAPLNAQQVTLNVSQSELAWLDLAFQLCSAGVLFAWGALALYLLGDAYRLTRPRGRDVLHGAGLAALIGIPGLVFYLTAVHLGLSKVVVPTGVDHPLIEIPMLLIWSAANAFGEEIVVVAWLMTRLKALNLSLPAALAASSLLRGSYHLYQGVSAGFGNIIMGVVYGAYFAKTGKVWPLVIGHFFIDAVAFVGYTAVGEYLPLPG
ncbi:CPBP family intramembrane glutamic endopeptidase [Corynebacterium uterequi]|nr:CPBP family intramembrane glutamic endopeptidase [Corynebacterium uterequi]